MVLDGQAVIGVSDLELRHLTPPTDLSPGVLSVTTSLSPREVFERLRSALTSRKHELLEAGEPKQDVVLAGFEHRPGLFGRRVPEAPRVVSFVAARPGAFPERAPLVELKARVGPGRTLALFILTS